MKTSELIKELVESLIKDGDREVILSSDSEGNDYSPLSFVFIGLYVEETSRSGYAYADKEEMKEWDITGESVEAIFFKPIR